MAMCEKVILNAELTKPSPIRHFSLALREVLDCLIIGLSDSKNQTVLIYVLLQEFTQY